MKKCNKIEVFDTWFGLIFAWLIPFDLIWNSLFLNACKFVKICSPYGVFAYQMCESANFSPKNSAYFWDPKFTFLLNNPTLSLQKSTVKIRVKTICLQILNKFYLTLKPSVEQAHNKIILLKNIEHNLFKFSTIKSNINLVRAKTWKHNSNEKCIKTESWLIYSPDNCVVCASVDDIETRCIKMYAHHIFVVNLLAPYGNTVDRVLY